MPAQRMLFLVGKFATAQGTQTAARTGLRSSSPQKRIPRIAGR
jgi:hypothetical protein